MHRIISENRLGIVKMNKLMRLGPVVPSSNAKDGLQTELRRVEWSIIFWSMERNAIHDVAVRHGAEDYFNLRGRSCF